MCIRDRLLVLAYTFVVSYALYWMTDKIIPMRVSRTSEKIGLDKSQHDEVYGGETGLAEDSMSAADWYRNME